jgi:hypothetical protein
MLLFALPNSAAHGAADMKSHAAKNRGKDRSACRVSAPSAPSFQGFQTLQGSAPQAFALALAPFQVPLAVAATPAPSAGAAARLGMAKLPGLPIRQMATFVFKPSITLQTLHAGCRNDS